MAVRRTSYQVLDKKSEFREISCCIGVEVGLWPAGTVDLPFQEITDHQVAMISGLGSVLLRHTRRRNYFMDLFSLSFEGAWMG